MINIGSSQRSAILSREDQIVISRIKYYDTSFSVPSNGIQVQYEQSGKILFGKDGYSALPLLHMDWSGGYPAGVRQGTYIGVYAGYLYAEYSGTYTIGLICNGYAVLKMDNSYGVDSGVASSLNINTFLSASSLITCNNLTNSKDSESHASINLVAGKWYPFVLLYASEDSTLLKTIGSKASNYFRDNGIGGFSSLNNSGRISLFYVEPQNADWYRSRKSPTSSSIPYTDPYNRFEPTDYYDISENHYGGTFAKPFSAGICSPLFEEDENGTDLLNLSIKTAGFLSPVILQKYDSIQGNLRDDGVSEYEFSIPFGSPTTTIIDSITYGDEGAIYDNDRDSYNVIMSGNGIRIKKYNFIEIEAGYSTTGRSPTTGKPLTPNELDYIKRITGQILKLSLVRNRKESRLSISIRSILNYPMESIQENFPKNIDYFINGWTNNYGAAQPAGAWLSHAYDAWPLHQAIRNVYMNSGIDPVYLFEKNVHITDSGNYIWGSYQIEDKDIILSHDINYGRNTNAWILDETDSSDGFDYKWKKDWGSKLIDFINDMSRNYGFKSGVRNDGSVYLKSAFAPKVKSVKDYYSSNGTNDFVVDNVSNWSNYVTIKNIGGKDLTTVVQNAYVELDFTGRQPSLTVIRNGISSSIKIEVKQSSGSYTNVTSIVLGGEVFSNVSGIYNLALSGYSSKRYYSDGPDQITNENPCELIIRAPSSLQEPNTNLFKIENYIIKITKLDSGVSTFFGFDSLFVNEYMPDFPTWRFSTASSSTESLLSNIDISNEFLDVRNAITTIGSYASNILRASGKVAKHDVVNNSNESDYSPQQSVTQLYFASKALDWASIYDRTARNYVGKLIPFVIIESSINSQSRADWISLFELFRYRQSILSGTWNSIGITLLEPGDAVILNDSEYNSITTNNIQYIKSITETIERGKYIINVNSTGLPPLPSYTPKVSAGKDVFDGFICVPSLFEGYLVKSQDVDQYGNPDYATVDDALISNPLINGQRKYPTPVTVVGDVIKDYRPGVIDPLKITSSNGSKYVKFNFAMSENGYIRLAVIRKDSPSSSPVAYIQFSGAGNNKSSNSLFEYGEHTIFWDGNKNIDGNNNYLMNGEYSIRVYSWSEAEGIEMASVKNDFTIPSYFEIWHLSTFKSSIRNTSVTLNQTYNRVEFQFTTTEPFRFDDPAIVINCRTESIFWVSKNNFMLQESLNKDINIKPADIQIISGKTADDIYLPNNTFRFYFPLDKLQDYYFSESGIGTNVEYQGNFPVTLVGNGGFVEEFRKWVMRFTIYAKSIQNVVVLEGKEVSEPASFSSGIYEIPPKSGFGSWTVNGGNSDGKLVHQQNVTDATGYSKAFLSLWELLKQIQVGNWNLGGGDTGNYRRQQAAICCWYIGAFGNAGNNWEGWYQQNGFYKDVNNNPYFPVWRNEVNGHMAFVYRSEEDINSGFYTQHISYISDNIIVEPNGGNNNSAIYFYNTGIPSARYGAQFSGADFHVEKGHIRYPNDDLSDSNSTLDGWKIRYCYWSQKPKNGELSVKSDDFTYVYDTHFLWTAWENPTISVNGYFCKCVYADGMGKISPFIHLGSGWANYNNIKSYQTNANFYSGNIESDLQRAANINLSIIREGNVNNVLQLSYNHANGYSGGISTDESRTTRANAGLVYKVTGGKPWEGTPYWVGSDVSIWIGSGRYNLGYGSTLYMCWWKREGDKFIQYTGKWEDA